MQDDRPCNSGALVREDSRSSRVSRKEPDLDYQPVPDITSVCMCVRVCVDAKGNESTSGSRAPALFHSCDYQANHGSEHQQPNN